MIRTLLKAYAYAKKPKLTFAVLHPTRTARLAKVPYDLRNAYAPRLTAVAAAALIAPLAYGLGRWAASGDDPAPDEAGAARIRVVRAP